MRRKFITVILALPMLSDCFAATATSRFEKAEPVWAKGQAEEMNSSVRFKAVFEAEAGSTLLLRITGTSAYRIRLNGRHVGYGPVRSPKGFFRVDEWPLEAAMREGCNNLEIDAAGYNCNSFYFQDQPAFLQAEVVADGRVLAATAADGDNFAAESTERIRKVPRYSFQRTFVEAYRLGNEAKRLPLERRPDVRHLERIASYPKFELNERIRVISRAKAACEPDAQAEGVFFIDTDGKDPKFKAFGKGELESNPWDAAQKIKLSERVPCVVEHDAPISLSGGESVRMDAGLNDCGFFGMKVKVTKPGRILFAFDEVLTDGEVDPRRMTCCNCVEWRFERPGTYEVETFEPYVWRYADMTAIDGDFEVSGLHVRTYKNPDADRAAFRCSDPAFEKIFEAARETFVQNAVDVFTDCPSRERAGWLCDSFFIGRVNKFLTGDTKLERLFLQNYAIADEFEYIPKGAIPMCYPADELRGRFIPNWAMWLVIEVEEYLKRSGDRAMVDAFKPRLTAFIDYMKTFRNSDGLLEKLPSWVFVEWSQANKLVQDVNYPSNMTWAEVLDVMDRLYGMPELADEAEKVREAVRRQSWTGRWFCDNAVRQTDGSLKLSGECTETCQYYAFFFHTATPKTYPRLWKTLVDDFGPKRLGADMKTLKSHPEIWPSNAFIGNYLRLECLAREGLSGSILDETKGFFLYMAERTGTLWEMISPTASCDHGFASHAAVYLFRDILGVKSVDLKSRTVMVDPPKDIGLDWCEGTLPVSPDETVTVRWRRGETTTVEWNVALPNHVRITAFDLMDQTDIHNELVRTREWTAQWNERKVEIETGHITKRLEKGIWDPAKLKQCLEEYHASYLSIHGFPDLYWEKNKHVWKETANRMGYRLELRRVEYPDVVKVSERVIVKSTWVNVGVAPQYANASLTWNLLNDKGVVCWSVTDPKFGFRSLEPKWDGVEKPVTVESPCTFGYTASVPNNGNDAILNWCIKNNRNNPGETVELLKPGVYTLAVSVGRRDGKPEISLPLAGGISRVYPIGRMTVMP